MNFLIAVLRSRFILLSLLSVLVVTSFAQDTTPTNYVVIGAYSIRENAVKALNRANSNNFNAKFDLNPLRNLHYVFVLKTDDRALAFSEAIRLQKESPYNDTWVFYGILGAQGTGVDVHPATEKPIVPTETPLVSEPTQTATVDTTSVVAVVENKNVSVEQEVKPSVARDPKATSKEFYFKVMREDGTPLDGAEVTVIDFDSKKTEYVLKGNENLTMRAVNQSGMTRFECDLAGFRKTVQTVNYKQPDSTEGVTVENDRIIIPFIMTRLKKGDHSILYNVFFYKDAAIMRPESRFDLDGVLAMMRENPAYKIRIHGHTNGNASGRLLEVGETGSFFTLTGAREGSGSAKKLSEKRAGVIRDYLVMAGVEASRMEVKAWGGKKPIYDKHHTLASANVRVEVEVIQD